MIACPNNLTGHKLSTFSASDFEQMTLEPGNKTPSFKINLCAICSLLIVKFSSQSMHTCTLILLWIFLVVKGGRLRWCK